MHKHLIAGLGLLTGLSLQAAPLLQFESDSAAVAVGDSFEVRLRGLSFNQTAAGLAIDNLSGGQNLSFGYDPAMLALVKVTVAPRWTFGVSGGSHEAALGRLTGLRFGVFPSTTDDSFDIATFTLQALAPGQARLDLQSASFAGRVGGKAGQTFGATLGSFTVEVAAAVPEPDMTLLWLVGLAGLVGLLGRRRRAV